MTRIPEDLLADVAADSSSEAIGDVEAPTPYTPPPEWDPAAYPIRGTLDPHQVQALIEADIKPGHAYFIDAGGGKTCVVIAEATRLFREGKIDGVLFMAPNGPHQQVVDEQFPLWCAADWIGVHNRAPKREIDRFFARATTGRLGVLSVNYDTIFRPTGRRLIDRFMQKYPRIYLALDESSKLKSPTAQRSKAAEHYARRAEFVRVMSGTPILRGLEDLFQQYHIVAPGVTGHTRYGSFRNYFCQLIPIPGARSAMARRIVGYRNERELTDRVARYTTRVPASQFSKTVTPRFMRVSAPMSADQARHYKTMQDELLVELEKGTITVSTALAMTAKLQQIASGFLLDDEGTAQWVSASKMEALENLLDELDEPVIVFAPFIALQDRAVESIAARGDRPVHRYRSRDDVAAWKASGGVIVGNQSSGLGIGQNLQNAAATIYLANSFSSEARWQSLARTDRMGQKRQCRYWDIITPQTVDENALRALEKREGLAMKTLEDIREAVK